MLHMLEHVEHVPWTPCGTAALQHPVLCACIAYATSRRQRWGQTRLVSAMFEANKVEVWVRVRVTVLVRVLVNVQVIATCCALRPAKPAGNFPRRAAVWPPGLRRRHVAGRTALRQVASRGPIGGQGQDRSTRVACTAADAACMLTFTRSQHACAVRQGCVTVYAGQEAGG